MKRNPIGSQPVKDNNKTIVVFSRDLDKAIASFIIANGASKYGKKGNNVSLPSGALIFLESRIR